MAQTKTALRDETGQKYRDAAVIALVVFAACLFGILTRPVGFLAAFWSANAILAGLMVRNPRMSTWLGWSGAFTGYVIADLITGTGLLITLWLTAANLAGALVIFWLFRSLTEEDDRRLKRPLSVLYLFLICAAGAAAAALLGGGAAIVLFGRGVLTGYAFWFTTEIVNSIIILPVILTAPEPSRFVYAWRRFEFRWSITLEKVAPLVALVASVIAGIFVGAPGAIAFPVPALLWCAISYNLFSIAILTLGFSLWQMAAVSLGILPLPESLDLLNSIISMRLGITLLALGPLTVASINTARNDLIRQLQRSATYDFLTDALARSAFMNRGGSLLIDAQKAPVPIVVLMLDIDHFKEVNDAHGHSAGDKVLVEFAAMISRILREEDLFGRLGGEEFAVILPNVSLEGGKILAERIRHSVENSRIVLDNGREVEITVSIGLAFREDVNGSNLSSLIATADEALYISKSQGRNQVRVLVN